MDVPSLDRGDATKPKHSPPPTRLPPSHRMDDPALTPQPTPIQPGQRQGDQHTSGTRTARPLRRSLRRQLRCGLPGRLRTSRASSKGCQLMSVAACERLLSSFRFPSPVEHLKDDRLRDSGLDVWLKRDDMIHPDVPGNKWRKLKYNLAEVVGSGQRTLLTFGGAYSNHIRATAAAGHYCGFSTIGIIRGEQHLPLNPSLTYAVDRGMTLAYLDRTTYRSKESAAVMDSLRARFGDFYTVPEGGSNELGARGCAEIPGEI